MRNLVKIQFVYHTRQRVHFLNAPPSRFSHFPPQRAHTLVAFQIELYFTFCAYNVSHYIRRVWVYLCIAAGAETGHAAVQAAARERLGSSQLPTRIHGRACTPHARRSVSYLLLLFYIRLFCNRFVLRFIYLRSLSLDAVCKMMALASRLFFHAREIVFPCIGEFRSSYSTRAQLV